MACIEHHCTTCGAGWYDNQSAGRCPRCGSYEVASSFDEAMYDDHYDLPDLWNAEEDRDWVEVEGE